MYELYRDWAEAKEFSVREADMLKQKFDRFANENKKTGDPSCPSPVLREKCISRFSGQRNVEDIRSLARLALSFDWERVPARYRAWDTGADVDRRFNAPTDGTAYLPFWGWRRVFLPISTTPRSFPSSTGGFSRMVTAQGNGLARRFRMLLDSDGATRGWRRGRLMHWCDTHAVFLAYGRSVAF